MDRIPDTTQRAQARFADAHHGGPPRTRRLVGCASLIAAHPEESSPQVFDWDQPRAFYDLCGRDEVTLQRARRPHGGRTRRAMAEPPVVPLVHDTTGRDFTSRHAPRGAGPIGDDNGRGFLRHNSLAFSPDGSRLLGLAYRQIKVRQPAPEKETGRALELRALWRGYQRLQGMATGFRLRKEQRHSPSG